ncbi:MAG: preprotein translocase subunit YajC [Planctomycetes bacterium]|nr:preprotein translocase subunit YajC [Planctomycetota bacterium]MBU1517486.1 preprotein translocase subunit YajC [Planctomycetota bacterium]MBU2458594.1 preprotein translocase subunit YajC [Planctomycetota bacterium]MBU2596712.1 preprotein translocase subunit YajC [Planctomycetota bacterium]
MEYGLILAQADQNTQVIKAEDISGSAAPEAMTKQADPNSATVPVRKNPKAQWTQIIFIVLLFVLMYFMLFRGPKKRQKQQQQMVQSLKKNDRVQTVGGILGTVLEVNENEITIKIDESNNTKIKVLPSSISKVIG